MLIETTVVGSFPKFEGSLDEAIKKVVKLQLDCGIDVISDGEQRGSMISYFEQLSGLEKTMGSLRIVSKVGPIEDDLDSFHKIVDYKRIKTILEDFGRDDVKVKVTFTGPVTLGAICALTDMQSAEKYYDLVDRRELYFDFAYALLPLVLRALELGALVQIDEPLLSTGSIELGFVKEVLQDFFEELPASYVSDERVSIHVCGSIKRVFGLFDILLGLPVFVLSLGFSGEKERENMKIISKERLEDNSKKLGVGFISNIEVEDQKNIKDRYFEIEKRIGKENIKYLHPDCGFALISIDKVKQILKNMRAAADLVI
jgi:5-methyltetrahydropteroyltriglutamate--homocysteine methyltransferase